MKASVIGYGHCLKEDRVEDVLAHGVHEHALEQEFPVEEEMRREYLPAEEDEREISPIETDTLFSEDSGDDDSDENDGDEPANDGSAVDHLPTEQYLDHRSVHVINEEELERDDVQGDEEEPDTEDWSSNRSFGRY